MPVRYEYWVYETAAWTEVYGNDWHGQTFTPGVAHRIVKVRLRIARAGIPTNAEVVIKATDEEGKPTGADLATGTINVLSLPVDLVPAPWTYISLSTSPSLSALTKYAIIVRCLGNVDNKIYWNEGGPGYPGGQAIVSLDGGASWLFNPFDFNFEEWGNHWYHLNVKGVNLPYEDLDKTKELHIILKNLSPTTKSKGADGAVKVKIDYEPAA